MLNFQYFESHFISYLFPKAPIIATTPYGVQAIKNRKKIVKDAFAIRISTEVALISLLAAKDATFILRAWSLIHFSWAWTCKYL